MKKILKITGIILLVIIILLAVTPFIFKGKLESLLKETINDNVNAQVEWESLNLSLLSGFPNATLELNNFSVINNAPFKGDTLASGKQLEIELGVMQLFKNTEENPIKIDAISLDGVFINVLVNKEGIANYDIAIEDTSETSESKEAEEESAPFSLDLNHYTITDSKIDYRDFTSNMFLHIKDFNHKGSGDFSAVTSELDTETSATISFEFDKVNYFDGTKLKLDAVLAMDLENQKFTFKENKAYINDLLLHFDGFVQPIDEGTTIDLTFETPDSDFKNFLALIPSTYRSNLDGVETVGDFRVSGVVKGQSTDTTIPKLDISMISNNASFKYPDLPKQMKNINIDVQIKNDTGIVENTYVEINKFSFKIDEDAFSTNGTLRNLTGNMLVNLALKGSLNLNNLEKTYPLELDSPLQGKFVADMSTSFDMNAVEKHQYQNIKSSGSASLSDFQYKGEALPNAIAISTANVTFNPSTISLTAFEAKSGQTDINASGTIENLIPFVMSKEDLKGRFNIASKVFDMNDFSTTTETSSEGTAETTKSNEEAAIKIPDFLDAELNFSADKVIYDNLELSNTKGTLAIANEQAELRDLSSGIFGGDAGISGNVSTKGDTPTFDVTVDLKSIDIDRSFEGLDMLKGIAPIAKALQGAFDTKINLKGQLDSELSPILSTVSGNAFAQLITAKVNPEKTPLLSSLDSKLSFIDLTKVNLDKLTTSLSFKDGNIVVKPFSFDVEGITVNVSGGHSFTNEMNYALDLDIPAKYMGGDVSDLLSKLTAQEQEGLTVQMPVSLSGNFSSPKVGVNTQNAISSLTTKIVDIQKEKLKDKAGDKINDVLGGILGGNKDKDKTTTDSTSIKTTTQKTEDAVKDVLGGLFGKKKTEKKDTTGN